LLKKDNCCVPPQPIHIYFTMADTAAKSGEGNAASKGKAVWIWGTGDKNELVRDDQSEEDGLVPTCVVELYGQDVSDMACGTKHSLCMLGSFLGFKNIEIQKP
jgi:alpha-tubulin suppressor-like RCC1 family protein